MIVKEIRGDILRAEQLHVAFAVNTEGYNDGGLAGKISELYWPDLAHCGPQKLGRILTKDTPSGKIFHAFVVHSLEDGWPEAPKLIETCFNQLALATDEEVASITMGNGLVGLLSGADPKENRAAMQRSAARIVLYNL